MWESARGHAGGATREGPRGSLVRSGAAAKCLVLSTDEQIIAESRGRRKEVDAARVEHVKSAVDVDDAGVSGRLPQRWKQQSQVCRCRTGLRMTARGTQRQTARTAPSRRAHHRPPPRPPSLPVVPAHRPRFSHCLMRHPGPPPSLAKAHGFGLGRFDQLQDLLVTIPSILHHATIPETYLLSHDTPRGARLLSAGGEQAEHP